MSLANTIRDQLSPFDDLESINRICLALFFGSVVYDNDDDEVFTRSLFHTPSKEEMSISFF